MPVGITANSSEGGTSSAIEAYLAVVTKVYLKSDK